MLHSIGNRLTSICSQRRISHVANVSIGMDLLVKVAIQAPNRFLQWPILAAEFEAADQWQTGQQPV